MLRVRAVRVGTIDRLGLLERRKPPVFEFCQLELGAVGKGVPEEIRSILVAADSVGPRPWEID